MGSVTINVTSSAVPGAFEGTVEVVGDIRVSVSVAKSCSSTTCASSTKILGLAIAVKAMPTRTTKWCRD